MNAKMIVSGAIVLFAGNLLSAVLGLFREVLLAAQYGAHVDTDAYLFANTVPSIILAFVSAIFITGFIPLFIKERVGKSPEEATRMFSNVVNWFFVIILLVIGICYGLSDPLTSFFASTPEEHRKIEQLFWILLPGMLFFGLSYAQSTVLNSVNHFTVPALLTVINNIVVIAFMLLFHQSWGIYSVAWGFVVGNVLQVLVQIPVLRMKGIRYRMYISLKDDYLHKLLAMSLPIIVLVLIEQSMVFSTRYFAAYLDAGSASAINYANRIILLPVTLFGTALVSATYPSAVQMLAENNRRAYDAIVSTGIKSLLLMLVPVCLICMLFAKPIVQILFERGAFDAEATRMTSGVLLVLAASIVIMPVRDFFNKLFFSRGHLRTPIYYSLGYTAGFVAGCLLLVPRMGHIGIAVSTLVALVLSFCYLVYAYKRQNREHVIGVSFPFVAKILGAAGGASWIAHELYRLIANLLSPDRLGEAVVVIGCIGFGLALYVLAIRWLKIEEFHIVWTRLTARFPFARRTRTTAEGKV
jgi:murein biosynthesis integral membrane protein MurJ